MTTLAAPVLGPVLGGYISDNYHWSWIFLINVPVAAIAAIITWQALAKNETPRRKLPIDKVGLGLLMTWVFSLQVVLDLGKDRDWFNNQMIVILAVVAAIAFVAWVIWELTERHPAVDLSLFSGRNFALGTLAFCLGYALLFANNLLLPLWLQQHMGYTATWAGLVAAPSGAVAVLMTPVFGRMKLDMRILASIAFLSYALSFFMRSWYTPDASFWVLTTPLLFQGVAMACFFVPLITILMDGVPMDKMPSASGLSNFARITSGGFAASIVTTFFDRREALHQVRLTDVATDYSPTYQGAVDHLQTLGASPTQAAGNVMNQIVTQAYMLSAVEIFWLCGWIAVALIGVVWLTRRPAPAGHIVASE
jgi:DHA2 family multidrug resistance protein